MLGFTLLIFFMALSNLQLDAASSPPPSFDWRKHGVVAPPSNQGQIGNSLFYAVVEAIQSHKAIQEGRLERLSVSELQDCCKELVNPYECVLRLHGLCSAAGYPRVTGTCHSSSCTPATTIKGYFNVTQGDENALLKAVLTNPVSAIINAGEASFQLYRGGVYEDPKCTPDLLDHAVLVVGYGSMDGKDYWICQNSWGTAWGLDGYILIARNKGNMCGIASAASYPI